LSAVLDRFIPRFDVRERHEITIKAPAGVVLEVARSFDMQSIPLVRFIFWLRGRLLGARAAPIRPTTGLVADMLRLGWRCLAEESGRYLVVGAACQPWKADVVFSSIAPEQFAAYSEPGGVKIAWTLEAESLGPALTCFATETRALATDDRARIQFERYWKLFGVGIIMIRKLLLPAVRRHAERRWRSQST